MDELEARTRALREASEMCRHLTAFAQACRHTGKDRLAHMVSDEVDEMVDRITREAIYIQRMVEEAKQRERESFVRSGGYRNARAW